MRTYRMAGFGRIEHLEPRDEPEPTPGPTEILIRVHAASINRRDLMLLRQTYPRPAVPGIVPLSDGAGEVVAVGDAVTRFAVGDRVTGNYFPKWRSGRLGDGLFDQLGCSIDGFAAEYVVLDQDWAVAVPEHLTWAEAACLSCAGVTAWTSVMGSAPRPGQTVLTLGSGDVSLFVIQFAKLAGCRVIATTSSADKAGRLRDLGADDVVDYVATPDWGRAVRELTGGSGADLVVDTMGPETIARSVDAAARYGDVVVLIWRSDDRSELVIPADVYAPKLGSIRRLFVGSRDDLEAMNRAISAAALRPVLDREFPFAELPDAYRYFDSAARFGKVVLRMC